MKPAEEEMLKSIRNITFVSPEQKERTRELMLAVYSLGGLLYECAQQRYSSIEILLQGIVDETGKTKPKMKITGTKGKQQISLDNKIDAPYIEATLSSIYRTKVEELGKRQTARAIHLASREYGIKEPFSTVLSVTNRDPKSRSYRVQFEYKPF